MRNKQLYKDSVYRTRTHDLPRRHTRLISQLLSINHIVFSAAAQFASEADPGGHRGHMPPKVLEFFFRSCMVVGRLRTVGRLFESSPFQKWNVKKIGSLRSPIWNPLLLNSPMVELVPPLTGYAPVLRRLATGLTIGR